MTDEERKAIEELKNKKADYFMISNLTGKILLNLIEKQSKEIEELKDKNKFYNTAYNLGKTYSSKRWGDKIKAILGIEDNSNANILTVLQTIVAENARLEDIEDRKVQIEYNNVFNKGVKSVEDKIKAKIEEWDKDIKWNNADDHYYAIKMMQSLLEKE